MKKIILMLLCLVMVLSFCACRAGEDPVQDPSSSGEESSLPESSVEEEKTTTLNTPYIDLQIPASYEGKVDAEVTDETVVFKTKDGTELYTLYFGEATENLIGTILLEDKNIVIYVSFAELDVEDTNAKYRDGINTIIKNLMKNENFVINEAVEYEDPTMFDIKTDLVTLKYPNKWKDKVKIEVTDDTVKFTCGKEKLFDLVFKECDGYLLGTYDNTPIYIISYEFDETKYSEDEKMDLYSMSGSVNAILQELMKDSKFVINY